MSVAGNDDMVSIERQLDGYRLWARVELPRMPGEVFPFFADARNLDVLTPDSLRFEILTPGPIVMRPGVRLDYRLRLRGIPIRWQSEITAWEPPHRFVDEQRRGPYRWWRHEHRFVEQDGKTLAEDEVHYGVPGGRLIHGLFVGRDLQRIFEFRIDKLKSLFPSSVTDRVTDR